MSDGQKPSSVFGRNDVRAAIALGYVGLFALIFWPPQNELTAGPAAPANTAASATAATSAPAATSTAASKAGAEKGATPKAPDPTAETALAALAKITDYQTARWHPLHFKPDIDTASNAQCLACHKEILDHKVREKSPAGVASAQSTAWYQTLDTYEGAQESFHARHMTTPLAKSVMNLQCNFCHKGNDPREEAPGASATAAPGSFTLRKVVDTSKTCLMCHGKFPGENMGLGTDPWHALREGLETAEAPNGCLSCHAEQFRTVRHQVSYLNAAAIEAEAKKGADLCYGCHGGRAWYRNSYPYPRHPWPGMDPVVPDWAKDRPTESAEAHQVGAK